MGIFHQGKVCPVCSLLMAKSPAESHQPTEHCKHGMSCRSSGVDPNPASGNTGRYLQTMLWLSGEDTPDLATPCSQTKSQAGVVPSLGAWQLGSGL